MWRSVRTLLLPLLGPLFGLALLAGVSGCRSASTAAPPLACEDGRAAPGAFAEVATVGGYLSRVELAGCGQLTFVDQAGSVWLAGPGLTSPERITDAAAAVQLSRRGDQLWWRGSDGMSTWRDLASGAEVSVEASATGFVRDGDRERAFSCAGSELRIVAADGVEVVARDVDTCAQIFTAPQAPVIVYVGPEGELRVLSLTSGEALALGEVPYAAARSDQIRLSSDGRVLFHQAYVGTQRVGIFDLEAPEGERFIGAPQLYGGLGSILEAAGSGHVSALRTADGVLVITEDLWLNDYGPASTLISLEPSGRRAAIQYPLGPGTGGWPIELADIDSATLGDTLDVVPSGPSSIVTSPSGGVVALVLRELAGWSSVYRFRWSDGPTLAPVPDMGANTRALFVGDDGRILIGVNDADVVLLGPDDGVLARWSGYYPSATYAVHGGADTLVWLRSQDYTQQRLVVVDAEGSERVLLEDPNVQQVQIDADGERVAIVTTAPDPIDPSLVRSIVWAGAIP